VAIKHTKASVELDEYIKGFPSAITVNVFPICTMYGNGRSGFDFNTFAKFADSYLL
jgi:hypothetical protein